MLNREQEASMPVYDNNVDAIGRTPLVRINRLTQGLNAREIGRAHV